MYEPDNPQIKMADLLQSAAGRPKKKRKFPLNAELELVDNNKFMILLCYVVFNDRNLLVHTTNSTL